MYNYKIHVPASRAKLSAASSIAKIRGQAKNALYPQPEGTLGEHMQKHGTDLGEGSLFGLWATVLLLRISSAGALTLGMGHCWICCKELFRQIQTVRSFDMSDSDRYDQCLIIVLKILLTKYKAVREFETDF